MKWKDINKGYIFKDGSKITEKHQVHDYDCYKLTFDNGKDIILSKDHLLKINLNNLPCEEAKKEVVNLCKGQIPIKENLDIWVNTKDKKYHQIVSDYILGGNPEEIKKVIEYEDDKYEIIFKTNIHLLVEVDRTPTQYENQKIDDENYWIPVEGIAYLYNKYGEFDL